MATNQPTTLCTANRLIEMGMGMGTVMDCNKDWLGLGPGTEGNLGHARTWIWAGTETETRVQTRPGMKHGYTGQGMGWRGIGNSRLS